jgi:flagellar motility protein MotE (MotC chaperone)
MSSRVRLLPVLIGTAGILLTLRIGALASNAAPEAEHPAPAAAEAPAHGGEAPAAEAPHVAEPAHAAAAAAPEPEPSPAPAIAQAQTKGEAEVLQNLSERRAALDEREHDLTMREQLIGVTEKRVEERLVELKDLETRLNVMLAKRDEAEEVQMTSLVKTYESMKPADAARVFNKLDRTVLLSVASRMKPQKIGAVMAAMDAAKAQELTVMLALRLNIQRQRQMEPAAAAQPQPAAAAPTPPPA